MRRHCLEALLLMRSEEGMTLYTDQEARHYPALATLFGAGIALDEAVSKANRAGVIVVRKLGSAVVTKEALFSPG